MATIATPGPQAGHRSCGIPRRAVAARNVFFRLVKRLQQRRGVGERGLQRECPGSVPGALPHEEAGIRVLAIAFLTAEAAALAALLAALTTALAALTALLAALAALLAALTALLTTLATLALLTSLVTLVMSIHRGVSVGVPTDCRRA
jgi:hypothetical protein